MFSVRHLKHSVATRFTSFGNECNGLQQPGTWLRLKRNPKTDIPLHLSSHFNQLIL